MRRENALCNSVKIGDIFGELTVIVEDHEKEKQLREKGKFKRHFICKCSCGKIVSVVVYNLINGKTKSCGHIRRAAMLGM